MLILEGSDCLGKSIFAEKLLKVADLYKKFPTYYSHMSRPNEAFNFFTHYKDMMSTYAVQDRFHIGGIVWHKDAIWQARLDIIEGWLRSIGSMTIIFFASDGKWYRRLIENDSRGNMLSVDMMCDANRQYEQMVRKQHELTVSVDFWVDICGTETNPEYPSESFAEYIISEWVKRLEILERI